jgi:hypothetical protein
MRARKRCYGTTPITALIEVLMRLPTAPVLLL